MLNYLGEPLTNLLGKIYSFQFNLLQTTIVTPRLNNISTKIIKKKTRKQKIYIRESEKNMQTRVIVKFPETKTNAKSVLRMNSYTLDK